MKQSRITSQKSPPPRRGQSARERESARTFLSNAAPDPLPADHAGANIIPQGHGGANPTHSTAWTAKGMASVLCTTLAAVAFLLLCAVEIYRVSAEGELVPPGMPQTCRGSNCGGKPLTELEQHVVLDQQRQSRGGVLSEEAIQRREELVRLELEKPREVRVIPHGPPAPRQTADQIRRDIEQQRAERRERNRQR